ncbi:MAG: GNAT family N-acetyltransferase [Methylovulum sp.]|uniref:GNAT family N-acetyltransferase n=1 Tax=Methylovulum sp. TaxID=1916980 RepID=UPI00262B0BB1|nr:GNAT family N-acetyltransferase [Methylovulum sp.]MDD2722714.1 GNAT family N-acetyltransferase [Methylovulum sp.]MDD5125198.1 GNAT family N-acetyltransferase [Methylovulum sp.]
MKVQLLENLAQIDAVAWNNLAGDVYPFLRHEFLLALEQSSAVSEKTGWIPRHLLVLNDGELCALMPLYLKTHSRGEYVFDQQWANAYHQQGLAYYPKLLTAIPFTPCQGLRFASKEGLDAENILRLFLKTIQQLAVQYDISSWHCLFPNLAQLDALKSAQLLVREGVQFQWFNKNYRHFDDFLQTLSASKRKMIKRERRRIGEQGVCLHRIQGADISDDDWRVFFQFYVLTYLKKASQPYLNLAFFQQIAQTMPEQLLLVLAMKDGSPVGAALSFIGKDTFFGRYWGCYEEYNSLHFEACYYQGIDYCIEKGLAKFDSGAQGEHKIARGFEPVTTYSAHWIKDPQFAEAIGQFLDREKSAVALYKNEVASYLPFKKSFGFPCQNDDEN